MEKTKKILAAMFSVVLIITSSLMVFAHDSEKVIPKETSHMEENHTHESINSFRSVCQYCDGVGIVVCAGEEDMYGKGYSCGDADCLVFYYWSTSYQKCSACNRVLASYAYHDCKQIHTGCGGGTVNVCPY